MKFNDYLNEEAYNKSVISKIEKEFNVVIKMRSANSLMTTMTAYSNGYNFGEIALKKDKDGNFTEFSTMSTGIWKMPKVMSFIKKVIV